MRPAPARAGSDLRVLRAYVFHIGFNEAGPREGRKLIQAGDYFAFIRELQ